MVCCFDLDRPWLIFAGIAMPKHTKLEIPQAKTLNCRGKLISLEKPVVMGILNLTPDSFSDGGKYNTIDKALSSVGEMLEQGAGIIDIGGYSSRPGAKSISVEEELLRISAVVAAILNDFPDAIISIDTFRAEVAMAMLEAGVHMINDISAGTYDPEMLDTVAKFQVPFVMMHMQGKPQTMQNAPDYGNVIEEVFQFFVGRVNAARKAGIHDLIVDPGFGFGKTLEHNYELFRNLDKFKRLGLPLLIGISRKSMLYRLFGAEPGDVQELSAVMHLKALEMGADILRVHDVRPAARLVGLKNYLEHGTL